MRERDERRREDKTRPNPSNDRPLTGSRFTLLSVSYCQYSYTLNLMFLQFKFPFPTALRTFIRLLGFTLSSGHYRCHSLRLTIRSTRSLLVSFLTSLVSCLAERSGTEAKME